MTKVARKTEKWPEKTERPQESTTTTTTTTTTTNDDDDDDDNNDDDERISRAPFHVKHAQVRLTNANTKIPNTCI